MAIGNPLGYDFSITSGIVSATDRDLQSPNGATISNGIQTDAAINEGNSGGPLIDSTGHVIGINEQIATQSGGNEGLGFAVPIDSAVEHHGPAQEERFGDLRLAGDLGPDAHFRRRPGARPQDEQGVLVARSRAAPRRPKPASAAAARRSPCRTRPT